MSVLSPGSGVSLHWLRDTVYHEHHRCLRAVATILANASSTSALPSRSTFRMTSAGVWVRRHACGGREVPDRAKLGSGPGEKEVDRFGVRDVDRARGDLMAVAAQQPGGSASWSKSASCPARARPSGFG
jgi:hypothetical protein